MPDIVLTESQAHEFSHAREKVILRDPKGDMIGVIDPLDAIALANHRKRAGHPKEPGIPAERVEEYMDALQAEWDRLGGFDEVYMEAFLAHARWRAEMSPYQVIWEPSAWKRARSMWEASSNKPAFNNARKQIKKSLGDDPHANGIALSEGLFRISCSPLLVCFAIDTPNMQVVISDVYEIL